MKKICMLALAVLALTGCNRINSTSSSQNTVPEELEVRPVERDVILTCTADDGSRIQFRAAGDEITSTIKVFYESLSDAGIREDIYPEKVVADINASLAEKYGDFDGLDVQAKLEDDKIAYTYTINYLVADLEALEANGILQPGEKDNQYISLEKTRKEFESNGYACTIE